MYNLVIAVFVMLYNAISRLFTAQNITGKEKKHHHPSQFVNKNIQALALHKGSGTELILKMHSHYFLIFYRTLSKTLNSCILKNSGALLK